ncbi:MAG: ATPase, T2SS/T4P/T4SS family [Armatimonadota bacterium]
MELDLTTLLLEVYNKEGSDLHLVAGHPPTFRIDGALTPRADGPILDNQRITALLLPHLSEPLQIQLEAGQDVLVTLHQSEGIPRDAEGLFRMKGGGIREGDGVFRMNVFREQGRLSAAIRVIPTRVPTLEALGLTTDTLPSSMGTSVLHALTKSQRGLILIVGNTGSGKSTLAAAMIEEINQTRAERIMTIEHPIEYVFHSKKSLITQQTVGEDVADYPTALRSVLYSDPDVIYVGQSVDVETLGWTLGAANTGHLVFSVLHVDTASEAIQRIIESYPPGPQQETTRRLLSRNLIAVIAQKLVPRKERTGRVAVQEILIATPRIKQMILDGAKDFTVAIEAERHIGMQTMDDAVTAAYERGAIAYEIALSHLSDKERIPPPAE